MSQPALSLAIKELETELQVKLFVRAGRAARLTAAGEALIGPARQVLRLLETGRAAVNAVTGLETGSIAIASLPTLAADPVAKLVGSFRRRHPGIRIDLAAPEDGPELLSLVRAGICELGVTEAFDLPEGLAALSLGAQSFSFIFPPGEGPQDPEHFRLDDLTETAFVVAPPRTSTRRLLDASLATVGLTARIAVVTAQRDAILPLVLEGAGVALVPDSLAAVAARLGAVIVRPVPPIVRQLVLVHRPGPLSPAASKFYEDATAI